MARPWRIEFENALYYVSSSGNDGREIFETAEDRMGFLSLLGVMAARFAIDLFAYALLPHRYDVLLRTRTANLSRAMHWLGTAYTRRFHLHHGRRGHLFGGRYRSILVENMGGIAELSCFVHRRPLRLKLVEDPSEYPWSSYNAYAFGAPLPVPVDTETVLACMPGPDRHRSYREFATCIGSHGEAVPGRLHHRLIYGSRNFVERILREHIVSAPSPQAAIQRRILCDRDPRQVLDQMVAALAPIADTLAGEGELTCRDLRMFLLWRTGLFRNRDIGSLFGLSHSAVSRRVRCFDKRLRENRDLAGRLETVGRETQLFSLGRKRAAGGQDREPSSVHPSCAILPTITPGGHHEERSEA